MKWNSQKKNGKGLFFCLGVAIPAWFAGKIFPVAGGAVIAIMAGMIITMFIKDKSPFMGGIHFSSKKILQWAVILLGFGLNLQCNSKTGRESLPIIVHNHDFHSVIAYVFYIRQCIFLPIFQPLIRVGSPSAEFYRLSPPRLR